MNLFINQLQNKKDFRKAVYSGDIFLNTNLQAPVDLCNFARHSITAAFEGETNHQALHTMMPVEEFVTLVTRLKGQFTNCLEVKEMIRRFVLEIGADPAEYMFDVPRIRVVPNYNYLHAGVSYAYKRASRHLVRRFGLPDQYLDAGLYDSAGPDNDDQSRLLRCPG